MRTPKEWGNEVVDAVLFGKRALVEDTINRIQAHAKGNAETPTVCAFEFGHKCAEQGMSLEAALAKLHKTIEGA